MQYEVSVRIQSECGKIRARKNSVFGHFVIISYTQDYVNVYIDRKFNKVKLNSVAFLAKIIIEINRSKRSSRKNVETFGSFKKASLLIILK